MRSTIAELEQKHELDLSAVAEQHARQLNESVEVASQRKHEELSVTIDKLRTSSVHMESQVALEKAKREEAEARFHEANHAHATVNGAHVRVMM